MLKNDNEKGTRLTLEEAKDIISRFNLGGLTNCREEGKGVRSFLTFDEVEATEEHLIFKQLNGDDETSIPLSEITEDIFLVHGDMGSAFYKMLEFILANGERWLVNSFGKTIRRPRNHEVCEEIEIEDFFEMLKKHNTFVVSQIRSQIKVNAVFDAVEIIDTDDDPDWDDERELRVIFKDTRDEYANCTITADDYITKFYLATENDAGCYVLVGLKDTPHADIGVMMRYSN